MCLEALLLILSKKLYIYKFNSISIMNDWLTPRRASVRLYQSVNNCDLFSVSVGGHQRYSFHLWRSICGVREDYSGEVRVVNIMEYHRLKDP